MKFLFAFGLILTAAACASTARAQDALPPVEEPPALVPLPKQDALPPTEQPPALVPLAKPEKRVRAIRIRNVPSSIIAWQLDPQHNPPPSGLNLAQFGRDAQPPTPPDSAVPERFDTLAQWVQIDADTLAQQLPAWSASEASGWARQATPQERETLDKLNAARAITPLTQRIFALDKSPVVLSYLPFRPVIEAPAPSLREVLPSDHKLMPQPPPDSLFADPPYIPNLAATVPMLPFMAPMPNSGVAPTAPSPPDFEIIPDTAYINPYLRAQPGGLNDMQGFKFQLTAARGEDKSIVLTLRRLSALASSPLSIALAENETAVFSLPDIVSQDEAKTRRTFLLVTPRAPAPLPALPQP